MRGISFIKFSFIFLSEGLMKTRGSMFSEETLLHHSMSEEGTQVYSFQCKNKQEGTYVEISSDCTVYHVCQKSSKHGQDLKLSTYLCPPGARFHLESLKCVWWNDVICEDGFSNSIPQRITPKSFTDEQNVQIKPLKAKKRLGRRYLRDYPRNDVFRIDFSTPSEAFVNNPQRQENDGFDCFLCCKPKENKYNPVPATPKPTFEESFSWTPFPSTSTQRPQIVWSPAITTTRRPQVPFSWIPAQSLQTTRPTALPQVPLSQIQVLEVKNRPVDEITSENCDGNEKYSLPDYTQPSDILLKFKVFPPRLSVPIDDAVVVENDHVVKAKNYDKNFYHPKK